MTVPMATNVFREGSLNFLLPFSEVQKYLRLTRLIITFTRKNIFLFQRSEAFYYNDQRTVTMRFKGCI